MFGSKSFHRVREKRVRKFRPQAWAVLLVGSMSYLAILTLLVTVIGRGNVAAVAISAFSAFFPVYFTIRQGVKEIPGDYFHVASVFKVGRVQTFTKMILPSIFPNLVTG